MAMQPHVQHPPKTLAEGAVCFGCILAILTAAAMGLQWAMGLLP